MFIKNLSKNRSVFIKFLVSEKGKAQIILWRIKYRYQNVHIFEMWAKIKNIKFNRTNVSINFYKFKFLSYKKPNVFIKMKEGYLNNSTHRLAYVCLHPLK